MSACVNQQYWYMYVHAAPKAPFCGLLVNEIQLFSTYRSLAILVHWSVFNLEISQSGSNVAHVILNWVILKIVWVKPCYTKRKKLWKTDIITTIIQEYFTNSLCFSQFDSFIAVKSRIT